MPKGQRSVPTVEVLPGPPNVRTAALEHGDEEFRLYLAFRSLLWQLRVLTHVLKLSHRERLAVAEGLVRELLDEDAQVQPVDPC